MRDRVKLFSNVENKMLICEEDGQTMLLFPDLASYQLSDIGLPQTNQHF